MDTGLANPVIYGRYLKPQNEWGWQVAIYLYLAGIGSGSFAIGILMEWLGYSQYSLRPMILWGPILVAIGALFLVLKLGVKRRFLNTILNPRSSWLSRGFYILSMCIIVGVVILGISILPRLGISVSNWSSPLLVLDIIGFILALATAIYTGILIQSVKYVALWNTSLLPALFTVSALSTGTMAVILSTLGYSILTPAEGYPYQLMNALTITEQILIIIEAFVFALYLFSRYKAEEYGKDSVRLLLSGNLKFVFWIGIIVLGFFFPVILEGIYSRFHEQHFLLFLAGSSLLIGGFFLRYGIVYAGIKEQHPLQRLMEYQYNLRALKETRE
ncbi:NrfD/PsrC family molybdoenzyme membrane anchor subunit [Chloroflexota bacterium]